MFLRQVKSYVEVVKCHSFTVAAEKCFVSQSAISQQISGLEEELGVTLLNRTNRGFSLTPAGKFFYERGLKLLAIVGQFMDETRAVANKKFTMNIRILNGCVGSMFSDVVAEFSEAYPNITMNVVSCSVRALDSISLNGDCDIVISVRKPPLADGCSEKELCTLNCFAEIGSSTPLAKKGSVDIDSLYDVACVLVADENDRDSIRKYYDDLLSVGTNIFFVKNEEEAMKKIRMGGSFIPVLNSPLMPLLPDRDVKYLSIHNFDGSPVTMNLSAYYGGGSNVVYVEEFIDLLARKCDKSVK